MHDVMTIQRIVKTLAKRKVMDGIQHVGFTHPIVTHKAIYAFRKVQIGFCVVLEIDKR
jgi:hypothetical protein